MDMNLSQEPWGLSTISSVSESFAYFNVICFWTSSPYLEYKNAFFSTFVSFLLPSYWTHTQREEEYIQMHKEQVVKEGERAWNQYL